MYRNHITEKEINELVHDLEKIQGVDLSCLENSFLAQQQMLLRKVKATGDTMSDLKLYLDEAYTTLNTLKMAKKFDYDERGMLMWRCNYLYIICATMNEYNFITDGYFEGVGESGALSDINLEPRKDSWKRWLNDCEHILDFLKNALYISQNREDIIEGLSCLSIRVIAPSEWIS